MPLLARPANACPCVRVSRGAMQSIWPKFQRSRHDFADGAEQLLELDGLNEDGQVRLAGRELFRPQGLLFVEHEDAAEALLFALGVGEELLEDEQTRLPGSAGIHDQ